MGTDVATLGAAALAEDEKKWSQPPVPSDTKVYYGWNEQSVWGQSQTQIVADDWLCEAPGPVTDIHWWGSFLGSPYPDPPMMPDAFRITFWTNVLAGFDEPFSHPGEVIWEIYCTKDTYTWEWAGWDYDPRDPDAPMEACFKFEQQLKPEEYFHQEWYGSGKIYWVSIAAVYSFAIPQYPFGLKTRERFFEDDAVTITDPTDPVLGSHYMAGRPIEYPTGISWDVAFELTTEPVGVKWDQPPTHNPDSEYPECFWGWNEESVYGDDDQFYPIVADDWKCEDARPITDIH